MSETYTRENFRPDVVPGALRADAKSLIGVAVSVGWSAHVQSGHGVSLEAPPPNDSASDNPQFIKFSTTERAGAKNMASIQRKVIRFADPTLVSSEYETKTKKATKRRQEEAAAFAEAERKAELERAKMKKESATVEFVKELPEAEDKKKRHIVHTEPLLVYTSKDRGYRSESTIQRDWSDGSVDYACAVPGCDFTSESRYGPNRGHRKSHVARGEVAKTVRSKKNVDTFAVPEHKPAWTRKAKADEPEGEAVNAFEKLPEADAVYAEGETLKAIRALLDDGETDRLRKENAALKEQLRSMEADLNEAKADAQKQRDTIATFRALIAEEAS